MEENSRSPFDFAQGRLSTPSGEKRPLSGRDDSFSLRSGQWSYFGAAHVGPPNCFRNSRVCHAPVIPAVRAAVRKREL